MIDHNKMFSAAAAAIPLLLAGTVFCASPAWAQSDWRQSLRPDGSSIDWTIDIPATGDRHGLVVIAQGSGCEPVAVNANIQTVRAAFSGYATLAVEKYGIAPDQEIADPFRECPAAYHAHNTVSQRVADYAQIVNELKGQPWWNGQLVLFGGSTGGTVMARLAPLVAPDAAIFLSTGGGVTFGEMILKTVPEEVRPLLAAQFDQIRQHPDSTEIWSGYSFRFWADALDYREVDDMLKTKAPLLLIQGTRDASTPVGVARAAVDLFAEQGRCNLTYWEYAGLDHAMADANGQSQMSSVLAAAAGWVADATAQTQIPPCARPEWKMPTKE